MRHSVNIKDGKSKQEVMIWWIQLITFWTRWDSGVTQDHKFTMLWSTKFKIYHMLLSIFCQKQPFMVSFTLETQLKLSRRVLVLDSVILKVCLTVHLNSLNQL